MYVLGRVEGHDDLTDRDRDLQEQTPINQKSKIGYPYSFLRWTIAFSQVKLESRDGKHQSTHTIQRLSRLVPFKYIRDIQSSIQSKGRVPRINLELAVNRQPGYRWEDS